MEEFHDTLNFAKGKIKLPSYDSYLLNPSQSTLEIPNRDINTPKHNYVQREIQQRGNGPDMLEGHIWVNLQK
ncbi:MAG: hypothetical protein CL912_13305 [Deltaproteobacteria bacterium]|nr:hypothetical protein [Deltaproteobacteria bacterium]